MSTDIYINLDCGAELQITKIGDRFQYEVLSLNEMESAINSTNQAIKDYFDQHNEYLANLQRA